MNVILAEKAGACYGVQRALDLAVEASGSRKRAVTLGPLIHNPGAVADLRRRGVDAVESLEGVEADAVIIRSHGVTPDVYDLLAESGMDVIDATCPHVTRAQKGAAELAREGCRVIVVGEQGHPEVAGLVAYARREGAKVDVVASAADVPTGLRAPIGVVVQTTQRRSVLDGVVAAIRAQGIEPQVKNTICSATLMRQGAAACLAEEVDAMVVIGGRISSNTTRLAEICTAACPRTYHVESADELRASWFDGCAVVGVTAGASTPESQIRKVVEAIGSLSA